MELQKLSATAKKLGVLFKVLQRITQVAIIVVPCVLGALTIANLMNPNTVIGTDLNSIDIGPVTFTLAESHTPGNWNILLYAWAYGLLGIACGALIHVGLGYIRKILLPMEEGRPFAPETAAYFKKLARLSLGLGIAQNIGGIVECVGAMRAFRLYDFAGSDMIQSITVNYELELGFLVVFFVLLLMSYIFSYGAQLQQLSDETL